MFISKKQKGYGWYSKIISKDLNTNAERKGYIDFSFKKGCEPKQSELNDKNSLEADLYLIDINGQKRKVFPVVTEYNGITKVEFKILEVEGKSQTIKREQGNFGGEIDIEPNELPFY